MPEDPVAEEYLGDGLYVSFDQWHSGQGTFRLRAPRENGDHMVYLEPEALANFLRYVKQTFEPCKNTKE